jgi:hypothetical protein
MFDPHLRGNKRSCGAQILSINRGTFFHILIQKPMKGLTPEKKDSIISLLRSGKSTRFTSLEIGVSQSSVSRLRREYLSHQESPKVGRPMILSSRQAREIGRLVGSGRLLTAVDARQDMESSNLAVVSAKTVRRSLRRSELKARVRRKKPLLRPQHREKRLAFATKYKDWTLEDWHRVIWSDETKINLFGSDGRYYCWRKDGGPALEHHFKPTVKHGGVLYFCGAA